MFFFLSILSTFAVAQAVQEQQVQGSTSASAANGNKKRLAPYLDVTFPQETVAAIVTGAQKIGVEEFTLAFAQANCTSFTPVWGPANDNPLALDAPAIKNLFSLLKNGKSNAVVSFGGFAQTQTIKMPAICAAKQGKTVVQLTALYQSVIDAYNLTKLDFDIEGDAVTDTPSVSLRNQAVAALQKANPGLIVSYTLPVASQGLLQTALSLLNDAKTNGAVIDIVNVMTMNFGGPIPDMGVTTITATKNAFNQVKDIFPKVSIGITPMIGPNDLEGEVFTLQDAAFVLSQAQNLSFVNLVSFWQLSRDFASFSLKYSAAFVGNSADSGKIESTSTSTTTSGTPTTSSSVVLPPPTSSVVVPPPTSSVVIPPPTTSVVLPPPTTSVVLPPPTTSVVVPPPTTSVVLPPPTSSVVVPPSATVAPPPATSSSVIITSSTSTVEITSSAPSPTIIGLLSSSDKGIQAAATVQAPAAEHAKVPTGNLQNADGTSSAPIYLPPNSGAQADAAAGMLSGPVGTSPDGDTTAASSPGGGPAYSSATPFSLSSLIIIVSTSLALALV